MLPELLRLRRLDDGGSSLVDFFDGTSRLSKELRVFSVEPVDNRCSFAVSPLNWMDLFGVRSIGNDGDEVVSTGRCQPNWRFATFEITYVVICVECSDRQSGDQLLIV